MQTLCNWFKWDSNLLLFRDNFFSKEITNALVKDISNSQERKREFRLWSIPLEIEALSEAIVFAREQTQIEFNTAILKEYRPWNTSWAYEWHIDPDRFFWWALWICTLQGESELWIRDWEWVQVDISTIENRFILANSRLEHRASPPKNEDQRRSFLFLWVEK